MKKVSLRKAIAMKMKGNASQMHEAKEGSAMRAKERKAKRPS